MEPLLYLEGKAPAFEKRNMSALGSYTSPIWYAVDFRVELTHFFISR
jgi:hypothetical protein